VEGGIPTSKISSLGIREYTEARETLLSPYAQQSIRSRGRINPEQLDPIRSAFQHDRDRIIHTNAFRRLKHKTQVFIAPTGDHFVTRLTHTLEVAQIARTIARALNLNEDLVEAISLGHDLGHTPFGHTGEEVLNELNKGGFRHNEQSLRVVDTLEKDGNGLNLSWEVRDGILNHSKSEDSLFGPGRGKTATYEAEVVKITDAIAYINHDLGDAIRAGMLSESELPQETTSILGRSPSARINTMVSDIIACSWPISGRTVAEGIPAICMSPQIGKATDDLRRFLFARVYKVLTDTEGTQQACTVVRGLYHHLVAHPELLPAEYFRNSDGLARRVVDYIAGMTDIYALRLAETLNI